MKKNSMTLVKVVSGRYIGRIGWATKVNQVGNIMFYPLEGEHPYVVCLSQYAVTSFC